MKEGRAMVGQRQVIPITEGSPTEPRWPKWLQVVVEFVIVMELVGLAVEIGVVALSLIHI